MENTEELINKHLQEPVFKALKDFFKNYKVQAYIIGGVVRDMLLGRAFYDIDIVVLGNGMEAAAALGEKLGQEVAVFKNFGTAMLKAYGYDIEFVGARKESYRADSRKPIVENGSLEDDQMRRDFTINALAIDLSEEHFGELLDPFGGTEHLREGKIITPVDADITFSDDPLRMLRAIRFATQLDFTIDEAALCAIRRNGHRMKILSRERITEELNKIIMAAKPSKGFMLLDETGLLPLIFKELHDLKGVEVINGQGHKDNFYHTLEVLDNIAQHTQNLWLRWAAILHDIAKPATKRYIPNTGFTFHGHEDKGARMVPKIFSAMKLPLNDKMKYVQKLVALHLRPIVLAQDIVTDSAVRRLIFDAGDDIDDLMLLCSADVTTKNEYKRTRYRNNFNLVREKIQLVEENDQLRNWQPPVNGNDIMEAFGIREGREVGVIKNAIREAIIEGDIPNKREEALVYMLEEGKKLGLERLA